MQHEFSLDLPPPKLVLVVVPNPDDGCVPNPVVAGFAPKAELPPKPDVGAELAIVIRAKRCIGDVNKSKTLKIEDF
jgi:hypothetical protein